MSPRKKFVLFLALAAALAPLAYSPEKAGAQTAGSPLASLLPLEAASVVGVDMRRLRSTPAYAYLLERQGREAHAHMDMIAALTGFDFRDDVDVLLAAVVDRVPGNPEEARYIAAATGNFNVTRLETAFEMQGKRAREHRGFRIFDFEDGTRRNRAAQPVAIAFLDNRTAVFGAPELLAPAIDRRLGGGASLADNQTLMRRADALSAANQIWMVSEQLPGLIERNAPGRLTRGRPRLAGILGAMQDSSLAVNFSNGVDVEAVGRFEDAEAARSLADALRGLLAFARLSRPDDRPLLPVLHNLEVTDQDKQLTVSVRLEQAEFEELLRALDARRSSGVARLD
jgi:hypothetical protein